MTIGCAVEHVKHNRLLLGVGKLGFNSSSFLQLQTRGGRFLANVICRRVLDSPQP